MKKIHDLTPAERAFAEAQMERHSIDEDTFNLWRAYRANARRDKIPFLFSLLSWHQFWQSRLPEGVSPDDAHVERVGDGPFAETNCRLVIHDATVKPLKPPKQPKEPKPRKARTRPAHRPIVGHGGRHNANSRRIKTPAGEFDCASDAAKALNMKYWRVTKYAAKEIDGFAWLTPKREYSCVPIGCKRGVQTPFGEFLSISEAAKALHMNHPRIVDMIKRREEGWAWIDESIYDLPAKEPPPMERFVRVRTSRGEFKSLSAAARAHGMSRYMALRGIKTGYWDQLD